MVSSQSSPPLPQDDCTCECHAKDTDPAAFMARMPLRPHTRVVSIAIAEHSLILGTVNSYSQRNEQRISSAQDPSLPLVLRI